MSKPVQIRPAVARIRDGSRTLPDCWRPLCLLMLAGPFLAVSLTAAAVPRGGLFRAAEPGLEMALPRGWETQTTPSGYLRLGPAGDSEFLAELARRLEGAGLDSQEQEFDSESQEILGW